MGCGVHFCEYSASQRACIQIGSIIQHLYAPLYGVSDQHHRLTGRKHAFRSESEGKNCFEARYVARLRRCRQRPDAEYSVFLHGPDGGRFGQNPTEPQIYAIRRSIYANKEVQLPYQTFKTVVVARGRPYSRFPPVRIAVRARARTIREAVLLLIPVYRSISRTV